MPSHFVFVDETGDLGPKGTGYYGYGIFEVAASDYGHIRKLLAEARARYSLYRDLELDFRKQPLREIFARLDELASKQIIRRSGLYIDKQRYGGRYLTWSDVELARKPDWAHFLRNYLLRVALEHHYQPYEVDDRRIDVILDRIAVNVEQHRNLEDYLANRATIPRRALFRLPELEYLTISDSRYTGALQIAHVLANVVKQYAKQAIDAGSATPVGFVRVCQFLGSPQPEGHVWLF